MPEIEVGNEADEERDALDHGESHRPPPPQIPAAEHGGRQARDVDGGGRLGARLAEHDPKGSAHTSRGFQGGRPSLYDFEAGIRKLETPALIVVGDEDDRCIEPALFLKDALPASGLVVMPRTGHVVNLEEPDLFNTVVADFIARVEAGRWGLRDPRSRGSRPFRPALA